MNPSEEKTELRTVDEPFVFRREWAMPNANTFEVKPIGEFVRKYIANSRVSIDPFSRNNNWATYRNDINPNTDATEHMDAEEFLRKYKNVCPDLVIFDPPYSPRQISECYKSFGREVTGKDTQNATLYARVRNAIREMAVPGTIVLSFGWNSCGMGKGWEVLEIMLCAHGGAHNDTICLAERRLAALNEIKANQEKK